MISCLVQPPPAFEWSFYQIRKTAVVRAPGMPGMFFPPHRVSNSKIHRGTCVTHVPWCMPRSLTSGFLWIRWRGKRSWHSRRMRNPQFCVPGKRPMSEPRVTNSESDSDKVHSTKQIQVAYQVYITFMNMQIIIHLWHINKYRHVGRPPLRSNLTVDVETTVKEKQAWYWWKLQCNLMLDIWKMICGLGQGIVTNEYNGDTAK